MKKLSFTKVLLAASIFILLFSSCKDDDDEEIAPSVSEEPAIAENGQLIATVGDQSFASAASATVQNGITSITANATSGEMLTITLSGTETRDYFIDVSTPVNSVVYSSSTSETSFNSNGLLMTGGMITITKYDTENNLISGTFGTTVLRASDNSRIEITNGSFTNVPLNTTSIVFPPTNNDNEFSATVNGSIWPVVNVNAVNGLGIVSITATSNESPSVITLAIPEDTEIGTFNLSLIAAPSASVVFDQTTLLILDSGSLTITSNDRDSGMISGTFNFTASDRIGNAESISVDNGSFSVNY